MTSNFSFEELFNGVLLDRDILKTLDLFVFCDEDELDKLFPGVSILLFPEFVDFEFKLLFELSILSLLLIK